MIRHDTPAGPVYEPELLPPVPGTAWIESDREHGLFMVFVLPAAGRPIGRSEFFDRFEDAEGYRDYLIRKHGLHGFEPAAPLSWWKRALRAVDGFLGWTVGRAA
jgi:hypothetical protein